MDHQHFNATLTGLLATASGITVSLLPEIEAWLRVSSLIIGCAVGIASFIVILRKWDVPPKE
jgi:hypothetical protein